MHLKKHFFSSLNIGFKMSGPFSDIHIKKKSPSKKIEILVSSDMHIQNISIFQFLF